MFNINEGDLLTRVHKYELKRSDGQLRIDVHEVIGGESDDKYFAIPNVLTREEREVESKYIGCGDTETAALEDCLNKIKDEPLHIIIPALV